jgi:hypothetical protein
MNPGSVQLADNYDRPVEIFFQCPLFTVLLTKCKISPHTEHLPSESAIRWEDFSAFWLHGSPSTYQNRSFFYLRVPVCVYLPEQINFYLQSTPVSACRNG